MGCPKVKSVPVRTFTCIYARKRTHDKNIQYKGFGYSMDIVHFIDFKLLFRQPQPKITFPNAFPKLTAFRRSWDKYLPQKHRNQTNWVFFQICKYTVGPMQKGAEINCSVFPPRSILSPSPTLIKSGW